MKPFLKKRLSQNFLTDPTMARRIVESASIAPNDHVVEIGCGDGALTQWLVNKNCRLTGIEVDQEWYRRLTDRFESERIQFLNTDFLAWRPPSTDEKFTIVGNLPYHVSSQILFGILDLHRQVTTATLMLQKEVVDRIISPCGSKTYGILSVLCQYHADCRRLFNVPASVFRPQPKVESSILQMSFRDRLEPVGDYDVFRLLIKQSFNQRRKMLRNSLASVFANHEVRSVRVDARPEDLSVHDFARLSREFSKAA